MNIRIIKVDLSETNEQLKRIADLLEGILAATNPIPSSINDFPEERDKQRVFYPDDKQEIVDYYLDSIGKLRK